MLAGLEPGTAPADLARAVHALGPGAVVVTGGHREEASDVFHDGERTVEIGGERHPGGAAHGSGCTHSSALAAHLALGYEPLEAARRAKLIAAAAVGRGLRELGAGPGPVDVLDIRSRRPAGRQRARAGPAGPAMRASWHNPSAAAVAVPSRIDWRSNQVPAHEAGSWRGAPRRG